MDELNIDEDELDCSKEAIKALVAGKATQLA